MKANEVNPAKWLEDKDYPIRILFDNGDYSVIWGKYEKNMALGVRWNGDSNIGYPRQGEYPTWYVEPDFIAFSILQTLFTLAVNDTDNLYLENIKFAINELTDKMTE
jgi:hypothetical protein